MLTTKRSLALSLLAFLAGASPRTMAKDSDSDIKVTWTKPSAGDAFGPGGTVVGEWRSSKAVVSPSLSLCSQSSAAGSEECGGSVWPEIKQDGDSYSFSLAVPDIASVASYYLKMKDDFGNIIKSPIFSLDPSATSKKSAITAAGGQAPAAASQGETTSPDPNISGGNASGNSAPGSYSSDNGSAQAPLNAPSGGGGSKQPQLPSAAGGSHAAAGSSNGASPNPPSAHSSMNPMATVLDTGTTATAVRPPNNASSSSQEATLSRAGLPTAAIAVPISLVCATLLASFVLFVAHRRSLSAQRERNAHLLDMQRNVSCRSTDSKVSSIASTRTASKRSLIEDPDIEKAIDALCCRDSMSSRHSTLRRGDSVAYVPEYARYPVPRQDVRRECSRTYESSYESLCDRRPYHTRSYSDHVSRSQTPRRYSSVRVVRSPSEGYARSLPTHYRQNSGFREHRYDHDQDDDECGSTTGSILSGYASSQFPTPRLTHRDSHHARPQTPLRSHSRQTAPEMSDSRFHRSSDRYDFVFSPRARSWRSW